MSKYNNSDIKEQYTINDEWRGELRKDINGVMGKLEFADTTKGVSLSERGCRELVSVLRRMNEYIDNSVPNGATITVI